jgi:hypothetical protein
MKKSLFVVLILSLALSACLPAFLQQPIANNGTGEAPQVNIQETAAAMAGTMAAQTIAALPTPTLAALNKVVAVSPTSTSTLPATINPNILVTTTMLTVNPTASPVTGTATIVPVNTATQTPTPGSSGLATPTVTLHVRFYGTLPPNLPFGSITLSNKSKAEAYISLLCKTTDGYTTILEYPVKGTFDINAPAGKYTYVTWVGGNKMTGAFSLGKTQERFITLYKDKVSIE